MVIIKKDEVEFFKRECKNHIYYMSKIAEINLELEAISVKLQGVSSPHVKDIILENNKNPYHNNKLTIMEEETLLINERNNFQKRINYIINVLNKIKSDKDRELIKDVLVEQMYYKDVANKYGYECNSVYKRIEAILKRIF